MISGTFKFSKNIGIVCLGRCNIDHTAPSEISRFSPNRYPKLRASFDVLNGYLIKHIRFGAVCAGYVLRCVIS